jgi:hypothetical protein
MLNQKLLRVYRHQFKRYQARHHWNSEEYAVYNCERYCLKAGQLAAHKVHGDQVREINGYRIHCVHGG